MKISNIFVSLLFEFIFHFFGVRRPIDDLDPENQPGSEKIRTGSWADTKKIWKQKIRLVKGKKNQSNSILIISHCSGYRDLDLDFAKTGKDL